ncbi:UDP-3-O-(3-hydroxymyristoyl)glucosamine N-acyltransferase [Acidovorax sp. GBBC 3334]|uniref:UDP-3-O-(3-hydroxymyristoyl)glucosamine N-acyltransferase n=1 Tax=Acidovorax sp. GBBC 3334 TaxID=2940496 RepID=UPI002302A128|nr:UDP-3-O-(3-hydroxymyristoyl)glucosamine N-acyltransferase [Acidovorax sp. GBBC 3334]MDA8456363.1 UDP-3-O-(3-hydroxymyristoyl)glucosamine N-acyltransferase [Acidovorax sp. GBBC 3334]
MSLRLGQIVEALGGTIEGGDSDVEIRRIAPLDSAEPGDLAFLSNPRYQQQLAASRAACVIVAPASREAALARGACIVAEDPYAYFARVTQLWKRHQGRGAVAGVHPSAVVDPLACVDPTATVGPLCVVERGAHIGAGTVLKSRVTVGEDCRIGERCLLHSGVVIGADGFGFAHQGGEWVKIEQLGAVRIGDDVEIGANTCIDRGALDDTVIEDGAKLDNLIQIAHNVRIGRHTAMAGCTGVAGSTRIGAHCTIGGAAIIVGHLDIADRVNVSAGTVISRSISRPGTYTGVFPFDENAKWEKNAATLRQLHALRARIKALEEHIRKNGQTAQFQ